MRFLITLASAMTLSVTAHAHSGAGAAAGFAHGFLHPFSGLDHVLAMVAVGSLAVVVKGRAPWLMPGSFLALMAAGAVFGVAGFSPPFVELVVALSVVVVGGALVIARSVSIAAATALAGFFALFHGFSHGVETPAAFSTLYYGGGFLIATGVLLGIGVAAGRGLVMLGVSRSRTFARAGGIAMSLAGLGILAGVV